MANQFKVYLNVNEVLMKNIRKGNAYQFLEVIIDGLTIGRVDRSQSFYIADGHHNIRLRYHYEARYSGGQGTDYTVATDFQCFIDNDDYESTVNVYFAADGKVEFLEGNVPFDPKKAKPSGCYVATCVYGSYDCPEVWTLRRFRDYKLEATWYGRAFIHLYYAISPSLVKWFGHTAWFKKMWKSTLDSMVTKLQSEGIKDTPYDDKNW